MKVAILAPLFFLKLFWEKKLPRKVAILMNRATAGFMFVNFHFNALFFSGCQIF